VRSRRFDIPLLLTSSEPANAIQSGNRFPPLLWIRIQTPCTRMCVGFSRNVWDSAISFFGCPTEGDRPRHKPQVAGTSFADHTGCVFSVPLQPQRFFTLAVRAHRNVAGRRGPPHQRYDFSDLESHRRHLVEIIANRRKRRQKGIVADFDAADADFDTEFFKIGKGSHWAEKPGDWPLLPPCFARTRILFATYPNIDILVPQTLVITTDGFESFVEDNQLRYLSKTDLPDETDRRFFRQRPFPRLDQEEIARVPVPGDLSRWPFDPPACWKMPSSGPMPDLYRTYMITNDCPDLERASTI
jgi:hypothetical protein